MDVLCCYGDRKQNSYDNMLAIKSSQIKEDILL